MDEKQIQALFESMKSKLDLGSFAAFRTQINSDEKFRKAFHAEASTELEIGDYNTFNSSFVKKKDPSSPLAPSTPSVFSNMPWNSWAATSQSPSPSPSVKSKADKSIAKIEGFEADYSDFLNAYSERPKEFQAWAGAAFPNINLEAIKKEKAGSPQEFIDDAYIYRVFQNYEGKKQEAILQGSRTRRKEVDTDLVNTLAELSKITGKQYKMPTSQEEFQLIVQDLKPISIPSSPSVYGAAGVGAISQPDIDTKKYEQYNKSLRAINDKIQQPLYSVVGSWVFGQLSKKNPNVSPLEIGKEVMRIVNPELYKQYKAAGGDEAYGGFAGLGWSNTPEKADAINRQMTQIGNQAMLLYGNKTSITRALDEDKSLKKSYTSGEQEKVKNKIASTLYNKGVKPASASQDQIDIVVSQLSEREKGIWGLAVENNNVKLPSSGFGYSLKAGYSSVVEDASKSIFGFLIPNQRRERALENLQGMTSSNIVGENPEEVSRYNYLEQKQKDGRITDEEVAELKDLSTRVNIRSRGQKIWDMIGSGTGQVLGLGTISYFTGGAAAARSTVGSLSALAFPSGPGISAAAYLMANEGNQREAIRLFPDSDIKSSIAAQLFNAVDMAVERIFPEEQVLAGGVKKSLSAQLAKISESAFTSQVKDNLIKQASRMIWQTGKELAKAPLQEVGEETIGLFIKDAFIKPVMGSNDGGITLDKILETGEQAFWGASLLGAPKGLMSLANTRVPIETIWNTITNPSDYISVRMNIARLKKSGDITEQDAAEKVELIESARKEYSTNPVVTGQIGKLSLKQRQNYFARIMHEKSLEQQMASTSDENAKNELQGKIDESRSQREKIFKNEVSVDEDNRESALSTSTVVVGSEVSKIEDKTPESKKESIKAKFEFITDSDFTEPSFTPEQDTEFRESLPDSEFENVEELESMLASGEFAMLTGMNPEALPLSQKANNELNNRAKKWLQERGLKPVNIFGKYGNSERSFFVPGMTRQQSVAFAKEFKQESVAHSTGLVFQDGSFNPRIEGINLEDRFNTGGDFFSTIKIAGKNIDFSINYDFDKKMPAPSTVTDRLKTAVFGDTKSKAAAAQKSLEKTGVVINMIEDPNEYDAKVSKLGGQRGTEGVFVSDQGQIFINQTKLDEGIADGRVIWHEASHPVVNIIRNTNPELFNQVVSGLKQAAANNQGVADALKWANDNYSEDGEGVVNDEAVVETIAGIAEGVIDIQSLPTGLKQSIIDFINTIAKALGLGQVLNDTDIAAFKRLATGVSNALTQGKDISSVVGVENVKEFLNSNETPTVVAGGVFTVQSRAGDGINVYQSKEVQPIPQKSLSEVYGQFGGKAVVINSDPTRVGVLALPSGKTIFMYGGPAYLSVKENVDGNVGFATTQTSKVNTWMKYINDVFGDQPGVTLVASQAPTSILSNSYALRFVMDGISQLPKSVLRSSDFKNEFFGKDLVLLKDAFGEKAYNEFVSKYKKADLSNSEVIDAMIAEMAYKVGDDNNPASFKARGAFVGNLLGGLAEKSSLKGVEGDKGYVSKKPNKFIAKQLMDRLGINAEKVMREIGEPSLVDQYINEGNWGFAVAGFETDPNLTVESVQNGGVKHPLFNAKFPGKNPFILDGAYDLDQMFTPVEMTGPSGMPYTKTASQMLAGSMYVKGQPVSGQGSFEYKNVSPSGRRIQASKGNRISTDTQIIDGFYSPIENRVNEFKQPKASATKWKEIVGVKSDEAVFSGLADWLNSQKLDAQLSKQDVLNFMKENRIEIKEVTNGAGKEMSQSDMDDVYNGVNERLSRTNQPDEVVEFIRGHLDKWYNNPTDKNLKNLEASLGEANINLGDIIDGVESRMDDTKYSQYQLPGGENYKEVLITLPFKKSKSLPEGFYSERSRDGMYRVFDKDDTLVGQGKTEAEAISDALNEPETAASEVFKSSHFAEPNIITHLRMNTRTDADGKKVLFLEEVQSDWGQKGKREGFANLSEKEYDALRNEIIQLQESIDKPMSEEYKRNLGIVRKAGLVKDGSKQVWFRSESDTDIATDENIVDIASLPDGIQRSIKYLDDTLSGLRVKEGKLRELNEKLKGANPYGPSTAPFVTNTNAWVKLGLKYALKEAVRQGADRIAWTTGEQQNERYSLSKQVDEIGYTYIPSQNSYRIVAGKNGDARFNKELKEKELENNFGKDVAEKIISNKDSAVDSMKFLRGQDLEVGGKGMKAFYGDAQNPGIVANVAKALVKELTGKEGDIAGVNIEIAERSLKYGIYDINGRVVEETNSRELAEKIVANRKNAVGYKEQNIKVQPAIEITPELRQEVKAGQPQFSKGNRLESSKDFKLAAFVLREKADGAPLSEIVSGIASVFPNMTPQEIKDLTDDPETWLRGKFSYLSKALQDNLISRAAVKNVFAPGSKNVSPAFAGMQVSMKDVESRMKNPTITERISKALSNFKNNWIDPAKGLPDWVMSIKDFASGARQLEISRAVKAVEQLKAVAKEIGFTDWDAFAEAMKSLSNPSTPMSNVVAMQQWYANVAAAGKQLTNPPTTLPAAVAALPSEIIPFVYQMRGQIDRLTGDLIASGYVTPEQSVVLEKNLGAYVNRAYKMYNERGWTPAPDQLKEAVKFLADKYIKQMATENPTLSMDEVTDMAVTQAQKDVQAILDKKRNPFFGKTSVESRDMGILKERKDIPESIRKLMGEYTDPGTVFVMTVAKQAALKASSEYLTKLRKMGMGSLFFEASDPKRPIEASVKIASDGSDTLSPLNGLYTTPEVAEALQTVTPTHNAVTTAWMKAVGAVRWGKTVGSIKTQLLNFESNLGFAVMNGLLMTGKSGSAFRDGIKYVAGQYSKKEMSDLTEKVISLGLVGQGVSATELKEMLGSGDVHDIALDMALNPDSKFRVAKKVPGKALDYFNKAYRMGDDFWKVYAYMNERALVSKAMFGSSYDSLTDEQKSDVDIEASERVKNTWPTYDRVFSVVKNLSKNLPILGNFVSFRAESIRVLTNTVKMAIKDLNSDDPGFRAIGARRVAGIISYIGLRSYITYAAAHAAGVASSGLYEYLFGDEEEKRKKDALKKAAPPFMMAGDVAVNQHNDEPWKFTIVDLSSIDPYGVVFKTWNAFTEGREGMEPGPAAAFKEFFGGFLDTEMTFETVWDAVNNIDSKTGDKIVGATDEGWEAYKKVGGFIIDRLQPSTIGMVERMTGKNAEAEALSILGMRPYEVDLHKSFSFKLSNMAKSMEEINKEYGGVKYKDGSTKDVIDQAEAKAEAKKTMLIENMNDLYNDFLMLGADKKELDKIIKDRSAVRSTGFDKRTKRGIKGKPFRVDMLFK